MTKEFLTIESPTKPKLTPAPPNNDFSVLKSIKVQAIDYLIRRANKLKLLHHFLYVSSVFGFFPLQNVLQRNTPLILTRCSWIYVYSFLLTILTTIMCVDVIWNGLPVYIRIYYTESLDMLIGGWVETGSYILYERIIRFFAFYYSQGTADLIQFVRDSRAKLESMKSNGVYYIHRTSMHPHDYNFAKLYVLLLASFILATVNYAYRVEAIFSDFADPYVSTVNFTLVPEQDWMIRTFWLFNDFLSFTSLTFIIGIVSLVGSELIRLYTEFKDCLMHLYMQGSPDTTLAAKPRICDGVETLYSAFDEFARIGGTYAFITTTVATISVCQGIYMAVISKSVLSLTGFLSSFCCLVTLIGIGNTMQCQIFRGRRQLQNILHLHEGKNEHLRPIIYRMSIWKWKLTARNAFVINNGLITGVLTTVMTYVIFQFQIRSSRASYESIQEEMD